MGAGQRGQNWLGLETEGERWSLDVPPKLVSGAGALFGGCATAAAIAIAQQLTDQPILWVSTHFGALARQGSQVELGGRTISRGRTLTHLEVTATCEERDCFTARIAAGSRPDHETQGQWAGPPDVTSTEDAERFEHPVHQDSWAARFEWRLAGTSPDPTAPWAAWWIRSLGPIDPMIEAAVLCDYVTYGMGRALNKPMGGLSIDNVLRIHAPHVEPASPWRLLEIRPEAITGGFGSGHARLYADDILVASGSQTTVMNDWDWRLPAERSDD